MFKLEQFTNLNSSAIKGDDIPYSSSFSVREDSEVVIKFTETYHSI